MTPQDLLTPELKKELVEFARSLVRTKSLSGHEEGVIRLIEKKMKELGFDEVTIDSMGNVLGRMGHEGKSTLFDSHVDTVDVTDESKWDVPPFSGEIKDGFLYGRGSVDMKASAAASIYAAAIAKSLGAASNKTIYVSCTVFEEGLRR